MSARDSIRINLVMGGLSEEGADALLDAYAHELAEKIRAIGVNEWEGMSDTAKAIRQTRTACANLIDPEAE